MALLPVGSKIYTLWYTMWLSENESLHTGNSVSSVGDFAKDPTDTLLLLYEFEARSKLNDPTLHNLMESVWEQPQIEVKTLEIIACKDCICTFIVLQSHEKQLLLPFPVHLG